MAKKFDWLAHKAILREVIELRKDGYEYQSIQKWLKEQHNVIATTDMIRSAHNRHAALYPIFIDEDPNNVKRKEIKVKPKVTTVRAPKKKKKAELTETLQDVLSHHKVRRIVIELGD